jgi:hypothetical protein
MILNAKDTNRLGLNHYNGPVSAIVVLLFEFWPKPLMRYRDQPVG